MSSFVGRANDTGATVEHNGSSDSRLDTALLVLRCAGLFLVVTFGQQKALSLWQQMRSGQPLDTRGFAQFLRQFRMTPAREQRS
jgi:hypothetical protein